MNAKVTSREIQEILSKLTSDKAKTRDVNINSLQIALANHFFSVDYIRKLEA